MLTEFGTFRDEAQTVKVHIGAGQNTDKRLVLAAVLFDVVLDAGNGKGARQVQGCFLYLGKHL